MKVKISTDSTCDLPREFIERYDIGVLPLYIIRDGVSLRDGIDITAQDMYEYTERTGKLCSTSAVTVADYTAAWTEWLKDADAVVHVAFSSELSASCNNARIAAGEFTNVTVVDSLNLSTGFGQLVIDAAIMAGAGHSPEEIAAEVDTLAEKRYKTSIETFMIGKIDILDLNDAQSSKDDAKQKHIQELYYYWRYFYNIRSITLYDFLNNRTLDADFEEIVKR